MNRIETFRVMRWSLVFSVSGLVVAAGCGSSPGITRVKTVPVTGQVTVDGEPQALLAVRAKPVSGDTPTGTTPSAFTSEDGRFSLTTYEAGDGVPTGAYKLTFQLGKVNMMTGKYGGDLFNGKYSDPATSEFSVTATETSEPIDVGIIELNTKDLPDAAATKAPEKRSGSGKKEKDK